MAKATKGFTIRPATHDDLRPIVGLYNWAVNQTFATVDSVHHSQGVGRALLTELIKEARGLGYRTMVATIATDNRSGLALHKRLGFEVVGTIKNAAHKFDRWMDITLVQRSLEG